MKKLSECTVLIVDDAVANIDTLIFALDDSYDINVALDGTTALESIEMQKPDLILLDINMPGIDGFQVCSQLKESEKYQSIPIIFLTGLSSVEDKTRGFELGAVDYITKPFDINEVKARVKTHLELEVARHELKNHNQLLEQRVLERTRELAITQDITIQSLASLAETRDNETGGHIMRTRRYVKILAQHLVANPRFSDILTPDYIELLYKTAPLHDIGKVGIPDSILLKPDTLTDEEFDVMKKHTVLGKEALDKAKETYGVSDTPGFIKMARDIVVSHHERWDGTGYPQNLAKEDIPLCGRLMAVADVYDALVTKRVYRPALSHEIAVETIVAGKSTQFDPDIADAFVELADAFKEICSAYSDDAG
ncbi:MAG: response regulator [Desulfobacteraceae bacterium]|nr:response regulator [Desulfobacteraceae bacterium]